MNEIDILTNAGLSRTNAEMVVALSTMASTLGHQIATANQQPSPEPPAVSGDVIPPEGADTDEHA
ncbi:MAG TPA: hypothetical protein VMT30_09540 [Candidatus Saccharimonadia bacterium]|nr:hypothetical protein [Candidatus Saccharimonadia bacterium]